MLPSPIAWHFILGFLENSNVDVTDVTTVYCSRSVLEVGRESCIPDRQTGPGTATGALPHNFHPLLALLFLPFPLNVWFPADKFLFSTFLKVRQGQQYGILPLFKNPFLRILYGRASKTFC